MSNLCPTYLVISSSNVFIHCFPMSVVLFSSICSRQFIWSDKHAWKVIHCIAILCWFHLFIAPKIKLMPSFSNGSNIGLGPTVGNIVISKFQSKNILICELHWMCCFMILILIEKVCVYVCSVCNKGCQCQGLVWELGVAVVITSHKNTRSQIMS